MKTQGRREIAEGVLIGTMVAVCSELAGMVIGSIWRLIEERQKQARKKKRKKDGH